MKEHDKTHPGLRAEYEERFREVLAEQLPADAPVTHHALREEIETLKADLRLAGSLNADLATRLQDAQAERDTAVQLAAERWSAIQRLERQVTELQAVRAHEDLLVIAKPPAAERAANEAAWDGATPFAAGEIAARIQPVNPERAAALLRALDETPGRPVVLDTDDSALWRAEAVQLAAALEEAIDRLGRSQGTGPGFELDWQRWRELRALLESPDLADPLAKLKRLKEAVDAMPPDVSLPFDEDALDALLAAAREVVR